MSLYKGILFALAVSISTQAHAAPCLSNLPESLRSTVEQDNWTILQPQDLSADDIPIWKVNHPGYCPGVATGNFHHNSDSSFVLALIQHDDHNNLLEKVILITPKKKKLETEILVPPTEVKTTAVVWSLPPRRYRGVDGTNVSISRDSFVYEKLVSTARQFYYDGSHIKSFIISY